MGLRSRIVLNRVLRKCFYGQGSPVYKADEPFRCQLLFFFAAFYQIHQPAIFMQIHGIRINDIKCVAIADMQIMHIWIIWMRIIYIIFEAYVIIFRQIKCNIGKIAVGRIQRDRSYKPLYGRHNYQLRKCQHRHKQAFQWCR